MNNIKRTLNKRRLSVVREGTIEIGMNGEKFVRGNSDGYLPPSRLSVKIPGTNRDIREYDRISEL